MCNFPHHIHNFIISMCFYFNSSIQRDGGLPQIDRTVQEFHHRAQSLILQAFAGVNILKLNSITLVTMLLLQKLDLSNACTCE